MYTEHVTSRVTRIDDRYHCRLMENGKVVQDTSAEEGTSPRRESGDAAPDVQGGNNHPEKSDDLKISGHIWSEVPALRRITIDDVIRREGDRFGKDMRVVEITERGAVFSAGSEVFNVDAY